MKKTTLFITILTLCLTSCKSAPGVWPGEENIPASIVDSLKNEYAVTKAETDSVCYLLGLQYGDLVRGSGAVLNKENFIKGTTEYLAAQGNPRSDKFKAQLSINPADSRGLLERVMYGSLDTPSAAQNDTISYMLGLEIGDMIRGCMLREYNLDEFFNAINDFIFTEGDPGSEDFCKKLKINPLDATPVIDHYISYKMGGYAAAYNKVREKYFLEAMEKEGYSKTKGGTLYKIIKPGENTLISKDDEVSVFYTGTTPAGHEFDGNEGGKPLTFFLDRLIEGWQETIPLIGKGGEIEIAIPSDQAYGEIGEPQAGIEPNMPICFKIRVVDAIHIK